MCSTFYLSLSWQNQFTELFLPFSQVHPDGTFVRLTLVLCFSCCVSLMLQGFSQNLDSKSGKVENWCRELFLAQCGQEMMEKRLLLLLWLGRSEAHWIFLPRHSYWLKLCPSDQVAFSCIGSFLSCSRSLSVLFLPFPKALLANKHYFWVSFGGPKLNNSLEQNWSCSSEDMLGIQKRSKTQNNMDARNLKFECVTTVSTSI